VLSDGDGNPLISTNSTRSVALNGAVPQTGTGITFPATQNSSSNANTLDDYEEGTWTPEFTSTGATFTYGTRYGSYTKIGNLVTIMAYIQLSGISGTTTNGIDATGFPFAAKASQNSSSGVFGVEQFSVRPELHLEGSGATGATIYQAGTVTQMTAALTFGSGFYLFTISYQTA